MGPGGSVSPTPAGEMSAISKELIYAPIKLNSSLSTNYLKDKDKDKKEEMSELEKMILEVDIYKKEN